MRYLSLFCLLLCSVLTLGAETPREAKTANPPILLHPEAQQVAAEAYY